MSYRLQETLAGLVALLLRGFLALDWVYFAVQAYFVLISGPIHPEDKPAEGPAAAVKAVKALLRANGYVVPERFQTRDAGLDRLIAVFDLVAYGGGNGLAIQFKIGGPDALPVGWSEASTLRSATSAIYEAVEQRGIKVNTIRPIMILAGRQADPSLKAFAKNEGIHIVEMKDRQLIDDIVKEKFSEGQLREMAHSLLRLLPITSAPPTTLRRESV